MTADPGGPSIVVAVDPPEAVPASPAIDTLALATGWPITLVHASPAGTGPDELDDIERRLQASADAMTERGIPASPQALVGPPVDVLVAASEASGAALIVVVDQRHEVDGRVVLGSVTSALLKVADRPVLVLPAGPGPSRPGFVAAVDRLLDLIDRQGEADRMAELREAAAAQLQSAPVEGDEAADSDGQGSAWQLRDALHRFETDHPSLTAAINDVAYYLSGMGI